jgi:hypothetical protein
MADGSSSSNDPATLSRQKGGNGFRPYATVSIVTGLHNAVLAIL